MNQVWIGSVCLILLAACGKPSDQPGEERLAVIPEGVEVPFDCSFSEDGCVVVYTVRKHKQDRLHVNGKPQGRAYACI